MSKAKKSLAKLRHDIYQSNPLVESCKKFSTIEHRVFYLGLRGINPHLSDNDKYFDRDFPEIFIPNEQLKGLFGNHWYLSELKPLCEKLFDSKICFSDDRGAWELIHIFRKLKYEPKEGLYIQFDDLMRPYILDLMEKSYTKMGWEPIFSISSPYAMRLLELMLQYQNIPSMETKIVRNFTEEDIRFYLNVPENAYKGRQDNFRKKVLDVPMAEINRKTKYFMDYTVFKIGRKTSHFEITLEVKPVDGKAQPIKSADNPKLLPEKTFTARRKEYSEPTEEDMRFLREMDEKERERRSEVEDRAVNINISPDLLRKVATGKLVEEELYSIENRTNEKPSDIGTLSAMENNDRELGKAQETFAAMKKVAESCGLKLEDFRMGEIPIGAEYLPIMKRMYKDKRVLVKQVLKEAHHMTLERFEELYKP